MLDPICNTERFRDFPFNTAILSHQSDFSARVRFCSSLQASLYSAEVDLVLLVCKTLWWAWSLLLIRICSSWLLGSNQSGCFLSGLPRYVFVCCTRPAAELPIPRLVLSFISPLPLGESTVNLLLKTLPMADDT